MILELINKNATKAIFVLSAALYFWMILANFSNVWAFSVILPVSIFILSIIAVIFFKKNIYVHILRFIKNHHKLIIVILLILSVILRFSFLLIEYSPSSDPKNFLSAAQNIAEANILGERAQYVAEFPYTLSYDLALGWAIKLFRNPQLSTIILNTFLDFLSAFVLYRLLCKVSKKSIAIIASILWLLFPFNIIFSAISLPISIVNLFLIVNIYMAHTITFASSKRKEVLLGLSFGITLFLLNIARPISIIICIAIAIITILQVINKKRAKEILIIILPIIVSFCTFFVLNHIYFKNIVPIFTTQSHYKNLSGWSIYVGSNYQTKGKWNVEDSSYLDRTIKEEKDLDSTFSRLQKEGIDRYKLLNPSDLATHFINKSVVLGGDQYHMIYNLNSYPKLWKNKRIINLIYTICALSSYTLLIYGFIVLYQNINNIQKIDEHFIILILLLLLGLFFSTLLVEVANRYFAPFFVLQFIILSMLATNKKHYKLIVKSS